nr:uncharacterized protein LOC111416132 [Onthophagus taurus]
MSDPNHKNDMNLENPGGSKNYDENATASGHSLVDIKAYVACLDKYDLERQRVEALSEMSSEVEMLKIFEGTGEGSHQNGSDNNPNAGQLQSGDDGRRHTCSSEGDYRANRVSPVIFFEGKRIQGNPKVDQLQSVNHADQPHTSSFEGDYGVNGIDPIIIFEVEPRDEDNAQSVASEGIGTDVGAQSSTSSEEPNTNEIEIGAEAKSDNQNESPKRNILESAILQLQPPDHCYLYQNLPECIRCPQYQICCIKADDYCRSCQSVESSITHFLNADTYASNLLSYYCCPRMEHLVYHDKRRPAIPEVQNAENVAAQNEIPIQNYEPPARKEQNVTPAKHHEQSNSLNSVKRKNYYPKKQNNFNKTTTNASYLKQGATPKKKRNLEQKATTSANENVEKKRNKPKIFRNKQTPSKLNTPPQKVPAKNKKKEPPFMEPTRVTVPSQVCIQLRKRLNEEPLYKVHFGHIIINVYSADELSKVPKYYQEYFEKIMSDEEKGLIN